MDFLKWSLVVDSKNTEKTFSCSHILISHGTKMIKAWKLLKAFTVRIHMSMYWTSRFKILCAEILASGYCRVTCICEIVLVNQDKDLLSNHLSTNQCFSTIHDCSRFPKTKKKLKITCKITRREKSPTHSPVRVSWCVLRIGPKYSNFHLKVLFKIQRRICGKRKHDLGILIPSKWIQFVMQIRRFIWRWQAQMCEPVMRRLILYIGLFVWGL